MVAISDTDAQQAFFSLPREGLGGVGSAFGRTRLRTFIATRWLATLGQAIAVLFVNFWLGFDLPIVACLAVIAASVMLNIVLMLVLPAQRLARQWEAGLQFGFDIVQVATLIALTGGLYNPFVLMLLAPATVASVSLGSRLALGLAGLAFLCTIVMSFAYLPLIGADGQVFFVPDLYKWGHFCAVGIGLAFFTVSALRVAQDETRLVRALDAAQVVMAREQKLSALGALSAATAHELGTPLATIHLVAKEMARDLSKDDPHREDAELLADQAERCRTIIGRLAETQEQEDFLHARMPLHVLIEEVVRPHRTGECEIIIETRAHRTSTEAKPPLVKRSPEILHALGALIENAVSFASTQVIVTGIWSDATITIAVADDGPGFSTSVMPKLGEPYISERSVDQAGGGDMGLGFFIAKTLVEQTGGEVSPLNKPLPDNGAMVRLRWPRELLEASAAWTNGASDLHT